MNLDKNKLFPNQIIEQRFTECVGETIADIVGNMVGIPMDAGFSYAAALAVFGQTPTTAGADPWGGMQGAIAYGCLPVSQETFAAQTTSELFEANIENYPYKQVALRFAQNGAWNIQGLGESDYDSIVAYLNLGIGGVCMAMSWFSSFSNDPLLTMPSSTVTNHCTAVYGVDDEGYLLVKPWLGHNYGYARMSKEICNTVCQNIYGFNPNASRWLSLLGILITRFPNLKLTKALLSA